MHVHSQVHAKKDFIPRGQEIYLFSSAKNDLFCLLLSKELFQNNHVHILKAMQLVLQLKKFIILPID